MPHPKSGAQEEDLFDAALILPETERESYLARACGTNLDLLNRIKALLEAFEAAKAFVSEGESELGHGEPSRLGPYHLLAELGEGGCGIVYLAEQTRPVKRQVAVKIIKPGMDTKAVVARFEAERQVLALLDHPNIAKVLDAGTTSLGRPYFVMELVRGVRVTDFCAQGRLTIQERLLLFTQVCQAIQHAHQKGIIHRDIKPSNVLVTMHDGLPIAKIIDFGIAKATQGRLTDQTLHTAVDQLMGTPAYISPEQTEPGQTAVGTRSDIYSLGVLLYELLTTLTPFDADELMQMSLEAFRNRIRTAEPVRPSRRLRAMDAELLEQVSAHCGTSSQKLVRQVQDDLDWIVMQCLEKEPHRRYQAVNELAADLDRYLRFLPVHARPPSIGYIARKLARRNRVAFALTLTGLSFIVFVVVFAVIMTVQAERIAAERDQAERERQRAQKVSNVVLNVFSMTDPFRSLSREVNGAALLNQTAESIERELRDQPGPRARLLQAVGRAHIRRGEPTAALQYLEGAVRVLRGMPGAESDALQANIDLATALRESGNFQAAHIALSEAEQVASQYGLQRSLRYADLLLNRGRMHMRQSRIPHSKADFEMSLRLFEQLAGRGSVQVAEVLTELSVIYIWTDDFPRAEQTAREALRIFGATVPELYPDRVITELNLAETLYLQNRLDEAASLIIEATRKATELFGRNSTATIDSLDKLAVVRYAQGRFVEAETLSREAVSASRARHGENHPTTANCEIALARTLLVREKYSEAEATLRAALRTLKAALPDDHQYSASAEYFLGEVLLATNRPKEAESVLASSMNRWKRSDAPAWRAMRSASALGEAIFVQGRRVEGSTYMSQSLDALSADPKAEASAKGKARDRVQRYIGTSTLHRPSNQGSN